MRMLMIRRAVVAGAAVVALAGCGNPTQPSTSEEGDLSGNTQVFTVPTGQGDVECISWRSGPAGGLDCDW